MFPRSRRLSRAAFPRVSKAGARVTLPHLALVVSKEASGYAVVVSKQVARLSTTRHRLKRQLTALLKAEKLPPGLILYPRAGIQEASRQELQAELRAGLARIA